MRSTAPILNCKVGTRAFDSQKTKTHVIGQSAIVRLDLLLHQLKQITFLPAVLEPPAPDCDEFAQKNLRGRTGA